MHVYLVTNLCLEALYLCGLVFFSADIPCHKDAWLHSETWPLMYGNVVMTLSCCCDRGESLQLIEGVSLARSCMAAVVRLLSTHALVHVWCLFAGWWFSPFFINWRDVQKKNVVNNVDRSSLRAAWHNDPYKNKHISLATRTCIVWRNMLFNQVFNENQVIVMLKSAAGGRAKLLVSAQ